MAQKRKKSSYVPGQLSLFDIAPAVPPYEQTEEAENAASNRQGAGSPGSGGDVGPVDAAVQSEGHDDTGPLGDGLAGTAAQPDGAGPEGLSSEAAQAEGGGAGRAVTTAGQADAEVGAGNGSAASNGSGYRPDNHLIGHLDVEGGPVEKYSRNLRAIRLLDSLGERYPTAAEREALVLYSGWGGVPQAFDFNNPSWAERARALRDALSPEDYAAARRSVQDSHYTPEEAVRGVWKGLERLGASGPLRALEPACGIGNFLGMRPAGSDIFFTTVELDNISARITSLLYPQARNIHSGFERFMAPEGAFDIAIGNPPFGNHKIFDPDYPLFSSRSIHNYFMLKTMSFLREGGIMGFVVSRWFMDAQRPTAREEMHKMADFIGGIRLPDAAFSRSALTEVGTDILFFQKNSNPEKQNTALWLESREYGQGVHMNAWFMENDGMIIGTPYVEPAPQFGNALTLYIDAQNEPDLEAAIDGRVRRLPAGMFRPSPSAMFENLIETSKDQDFMETPEFKRAKYNSFMILPEGGIAYKTRGFYGSDSYAILDVPNRISENRIKAMIGVRNILRELIDLEKSEDADEMLMLSLRTRLNEEYDSFQRTFGFLNARVNSILMNEDPEWPLLEGLEEDYDPGLSPESARRINRPARKPSAVKSAIFRRRVLYPKAVYNQPDNIQDAFILCLREKGLPDPEYIGGLLGKSASEAESGLIQAGLAFKTPGGGWETREKYLSGNVRGKLNEAMALLPANPNLEHNVRELEKALPKNVEPVDIGLQFGAAWVPDKTYLEFVEHLCQSDHGIEMKHIKELNRWKVRIYGQDTLVNSRYGVPEMPFEKILEKLLEYKPIEVRVPTGEYDERGREIRVVDQDLTMAANAKADLIKSKFMEWVWDDDERRNALVKIYNETFNTHVPPRYDGSHMRFPGMSAAIELRPHQRDAVWRAIQDGSVLFDHVMGSGKTIICIATIMESKRMGLLNKPMIVVPNHLLSVWKREFSRVYPESRTLIATKDDFTPKNRERFFSKITLGEWDAVVIAHSSFKFIPAPGDYLEKTVKEQIDELDRAMNQLENDDRITIKMMEKKKEKLKEQLSRLSDARRSVSVDFSDMGVDALFIDESQEFKNLFFTTGMRVSGLGSQEGSQKAFDLFVKCRWLQERQDGRGVFLMTGTPISNTIAEMYTIQRYMRYNDLKEKDLLHFDRWASVFGQVVSNWELDATGVNYKMSARFAKFQNVPELVGMYRAFADVVTMDDVRGQALGRHVPLVEGGAPVNRVSERSEEQAGYMAEIVHRMEHLPKDPRIDNPLKITNDARKAGLDYRIIDPEAEDFEGTKINAAVKSIYEIWKETREVLGTQLVFCDLSTPKSAKTRKIVTLAPDGEDGPGISMDEIICSMSQFSVYDDMKNKLIGVGIPPHEIAFIHDADTEARKTKLYADVNAGRVRVLMGSTQKMGAGMNVQRRLVAAHHLDAPWRPSDLEQRNGRIIRQGNILHQHDPENFRVRIFNYATEKTYDARMWQTIEYKAAAIDQFRRGDTLARVIDDISTGAATAAEMKAAASGNPLILREVSLNMEIRKKEAVLAEAMRARHRLQDRLVYLKSRDERFEKARARYEETKETLEKHTITRPKKDNPEESEIMLAVIHNGEVIRKDNIAEHMVKMVHEAIRTTSYSTPPLEAGTYRGVKLLLKKMYQGAEPGFTLSLGVGSHAPYESDNLKYLLKDQPSILGMFTRVNNFLAQAPEKIFERARRNHEIEENDFRKAAEELARPVEGMAELEAMKLEHEAVIAELQAKKITISDGRPSPKKRQR